MLEPKAAPKLKGGYVAGGGGAKAVVDVANSITHAAVADEKFVILVE